ncbi:inner membrane protein YhjD [Amycolatopsis pithecellobii]|uniref:Inner membrane protein YhjD n=1 Tax=Amycolatopsis pithecellobii TaxID=664692 RepID=A0A6N7ZBS0_9PSEU|nr:inner membrane protein YhjD [Amycolatopsis pithecellobii]MTD59231.1 inner membrane protein YhjD [Amycolatopsis pithecellobii]
MAEEKEKLVPRLRRKYPWLDHILRANDAFGEHYGNHYAAAITYFSVLSLFPLLMVGFSVAGLVLANNEAALNELRDGILRSAPAGLGSLFSTLIDAALASRGATGIFGLALALYSGIGWMTNLRDALTAQWGQEKKKLPLISTTLKDLASLVGLGLALVVSFGLTAVGGGVGKRLLHLAGLDDQGWALSGLTIVTVVLSLLANMLVFLWVLSRLPRERVGVRSAVKGAAIAAIGFEILKQLASYYLAAVTSSPSGAIFGPIIGLLVFANLVSRFLLFVTAWTATAKENQIIVVNPPPPAVIRPEVTVRRGAGAGAVAGAFSAGAVLAWLGRRRR